MIKYVPHHLIDQEVWDRDLKRSANRLWYAQSWVLNIASSGWDALIDEERGAMMPLTHRRKYGFNYLFQPFALQQLGVFGQGALDASLQLEFLSAIPKKFRYVDIFLNSNWPIVESGWTTEEWTDQVLDLSLSYDELRSSYSTGTKRNLKQTDGLALNFNVQCSTEKFITLFAGTTGKNYGGLKRADQRKLSELLEGGARQEQLSIQGIEEEGKLIAALVMVEWEGRSIMLKSASTEKGKEQRAMFWLFDRYIKHHAGEQRTLDFAGSMSEGVARFNAGFGAQPELYLRQRCNRLPKVIKVLKK